MYSSTALQGALYISTALQRSTLYILYTLPQLTWQPCLHVSRAREQGNSLQGLQAPNDV